MSSDDSKVPQANNGGWDAFGLGEVANQLVGPVMRGVGKLWQPRQMRRENKAQIDNFNAWDEALRIKGYQPGAVDLTLGERAEVRLLAENIDRQTNREAVAEFAIEYAALDAHIPVDPSVLPPDSAWIDRFWHLAERITDDETQAFWGLVLSRRSTLRSGLSARALEFIATLSGEEASSLERLGQFVVTLPSVRGSSTGFLFSIPSNHQWHEAKHSIEPIQRRIVDLVNPLRADLFGPLGVFIESGWAHSFHTSPPESGVVTFSVANVALEVKMHSSFLETGSYHLGSGTGISPLGVELFNMLKRPANDQYIELLQQAYRQVGLDLLRSDSIRATNS